MYRHLILSANTCKALQRNGCSLYSTEAALKAAKDKVSTLKKDPGNETKLKMYALYKQATIGDCNTKKPNMLDFVGGAKWTAWSGLSSMSTAKAMSEYVDLVDELITGETNGMAGTPSPGYTSIDGLDVVLEDRLLTITLNRPTKYNALTQAMYAKITEVLNTASDDDQVGVVMFTGKGKYYCSGNDLSNFQVKSLADIPQMAGEAGIWLVDFEDSFINCNKPLVAKVNGPAIGISVTVLALFDSVIASDKATFQTPFSKVAQSPEGCSSVLFPRMMGNALAAEVLLFNRTLSAAEALACGLVSRVFPADQLDQESDALVRQWAGLPPESIRESKKLMRASEREFLHDLAVRETEVLKERWCSKEFLNFMAEFMSRKRH